MDRAKLIASGWIPLQGKELVAASELMKFDMGEAAYAKKFGRKTVFLRDTGVCNFYVPFDRDDPERTDSRHGYKVFMRASLVPGEEDHVDGFARDVLQRLV